jgi:hypothetical protein
MTRAGLVFGEIRVFMRTDGQFAVFDKRKPLAEQSVGVFGRVDDAIKEAKRLAALDGPAAAKAPKIDTDAEAFAGMKRAMANGFAPHEPAEDVGHYANTFDRPLDSSAIDREIEVQRKRLAGEDLVLVPSTDLVRIVPPDFPPLSQPDCPKCSIGFCELECSCACHFEELPR